MLPFPPKAPFPPVSLSATCLGAGGAQNTGDQEPEPLSAYWTFYWAVAAAQLTRWLPRRPARVLDLSGPRAECAARAAGAGHTVIELRSRVDPTGAATVLADGAGSGETTPSASRTTGLKADRKADRKAARSLGRVHPVIADAGRLDFLPAGSMDAVIAEDRVLSRQLVTEEAVAEIARVLCPGGRMLLCVDSLVLGMAILAEQKYWAQLSDVPRAEVVLIPWPNGIITRCFWFDELRQLLLEAGLEVEWIRPRTVLSPSTVEHVLSAAPGRLARLVRTELTTPIRAESVGIHLVASAIKRA